MAERVTNVRLGAKVGSYVKDVFSAGKATDDLRTKAERFSRGKYDAKLGLNTAKARTDLSALERQLQAFGKSTTEKRVNLNTLEAEARALALQARLEELGTKVTDAQVDVDDSKAQAKLSQMEAALLAIGERSASADLDLKGVATAEAQLGVLEAQLADFDRKRYEAHVGVSGAEAATKQASLLVDTLLLLGPAAIPISAAVVPAVAAMSSGLAAAAVGGASLVLAFQGVGKALTAVNNYALDPTDAHLKAMHQTMQALGPDGRHFVRFLQGLRSQLQPLQDVAQAGLFPGLEEGIRQALHLLPRVELLISNVSSALGQMAEDTGKTLNSPYWKHFIDWLSATAPDAITGMVKALTNLAHGFAGVMMALDPMGRDFGGVLLKMTRDFAQWGAGLSESKGFHDFVAYVEQAGPQVADLLGSLAQAIIAIVQAAAPVGAVTLPLLTELAKVLTVVAQSPAGPILFSAAAGLAAVNRALRTMQAFKGMEAVKSLRTNIEGLSRGALVGRGVAGIAGLTLAMSGLGDQSSETGKSLQTVADVAGGALMGFATGGPIGAAVGAGAGLMIDLASSTNASADAFYKERQAARSFADTLNQTTGAITRATRAQALKALQNTAAIRAGQALGVTTRDLIGATLGEAGARKRVSAAIQEGIRSGKMMTYANGAQGRASDALSQALYGVKGMSQGVADAFRHQHRVVLQNIEDTKTWREALAGVPKEVRTRLRQLNFDPSMHQIKQLRHEYDLTPKQVDTIITALDRASNVIRHIQFGLGQIHDKTVTVSVIESRNFKATHLPGSNLSADGSTVPKDGGTYADRYPYLLAPGEEVISNRYGQADRHRSLLKAINAGRLADGGTAGVHYSVADRLSMAQLEQQIRQLLHQLAASGKNEIHGLSRRVAELQLQQTRIQLRQAQRQPLTDQLSALRGIGGLDVSSALGMSPHNPVTAGVRDQFAQFRQQVKQAGGEWTKAMQRAADGMLKHARAIDADNRAIGRQQHHLDALNSHLGDLNSQMDSLKSTMASYSQSVGGNFLSNPFGLGGQEASQTVTTGGGPAWTAAKDQLAAAQAHLAALNSPTGDLMTRLANAAEASRVEQTIQGLQSTVDALAPVQTTVTKTTDALSAFRDTMQHDIDAANGFYDALHTLQTEGINHDLFQQVAQSGDVAFATALAAAGPDMVAEFNQLETTRAAAAAQVAAYATQQVYGQQQAILQGQIQQQNRLITAQTQEIGQLRQELRGLGGRVQNGAERGVEGLKAEIQALRKDVQSIPRQTAHHRR